MIPCALACSVDFGSWLARVRELIAGPGTVVLKDVGALGAGSAAALADLLASGARCAPVISTLEPVRDRDYLPGEERFGAVVLRVPALRERREDIPDLVDAAMRAIGQRVRVRHRAMAALMAHEWPGNVAQLKAAVAEALAAARGGDIDVAHLPDEASAPVPRAGAG